MTDPAAGLNNPQNIRKRNALSDGWQTHGLTGLLGSLGVLFCDSEPYAFPCFRAIMTFLLVTIVKRERYSYSPSHTVNRGTWNTQQSLQLFISGTLYFWYGEMHVMLCSWNPTPDFHSDSETRHCPESSSNLDIEEPHPPRIAWLVLLARSQLYGELVDCQQISKQ